VAATGKHLPCAREGIKTTAESQRQNRAELSAPSAVRAAGQPAGSDQRLDASAGFINPFGRSCLRFKFFNGTTGGFRGKSEDQNQTDQAYDRDERHRGADAERFDQHRKGRCPHHTAKQPAADPFAGRDADSPDRGRVLLRVPSYMTGQSRTRQTRIDNPIPSSRAGPRTGQSSRLLPMQPRRTARRFACAQAIPTRRR
jgi:hypothetical protein